MNQKVKIRNKKIKKLQLGINIQRLKWKARKTIFHKKVNKLIFNIKIKKWRKKIVLILSKILF